MKKIAAVAVSIGVILVIIGLVLVGIYGRDRISSGDWLAFGAADLNSANGGVDKQADELEDIKEVNVTVSAYSVYVLKSETDVVSVKYIDPLEDGVNIDIEYSNGVLSVTQTDNLSHRFWGFNWVGNRRFIVIYLPQAEQFTHAKLTIKADYSTVKISNVNFASVETTTDAGSIKIDNLTADNVLAETSAGSIKINEISAQNVIANSSAGSIKVDNVKAQQILVESSAGSVNINNVDCAVLKANADAGAVKAFGIKATTSVDIDVSAGSVKCDVDTSKLVIKSGAGSIKFDTNATDIYLSSGAGSISGNVKGDKSEYQIDVKRDMGSSNISSQNVNGATKFLKVESDLGSIKIFFVNN